MSSKDIHKVSNYTPSTIWTSELEIQAGLAGWSKTHYFFQAPPAPAYRRETERMMALQLCPAVLGAETWMGSWVVKRPNAWKAANEDTKIIAIALPGAAAQGIPAVWLLSQETKLMSCRNSRWNSPVVQEPHLQGGWWGKHIFKLISRDCSNPSWNDSKARASATSLGEQKSAV